MPKTPPVPQVRPSQITPEMVVTAKRMRFNPIRNLTPEILSSQLESWLVGHLRDFAITAETIQRRDDAILPALAKRLKAPARSNWTIQLIEGLDDAQQKVAEEHQAALQYCFDNIRVTSALDQNQRGGMRALVRQMMEAVAYRYAVHEIVWQPRIDPVTGKARLTASLTYVPLWFFENTSSRLRFLPNAYGGLAGRDMPPEEWLVTVGDGLMECLAVCYMFKQMSLKDWVAFSDKFGTPGIHALTDAAKDTADWTALENAVEDFSQNWSAVTNRAVEFKLIEAKNGGALPFPPLVERMDRAIATICRGADLSTMSAGSGQGQGASLQGDESDLLEQDDAQLITEALEQISTIVIKQLFGTDVPLAYVQIGGAKKKTTDETIKKLEFLRDSGVRVGADYARQELGIPAPADDEAELLQRAPAPAPPFGRPAGLALANAAPDARFEIFRAQAQRTLGRAQAEALRPLTDRLSEILGMEDETQQDIALLKLQNDLPRIYRTISADPELIAAWENILGTALASGAADAAKVRPAPITQ